MSTDRCPNGCIARPCATKRRPDSPRYCPTCGAKWTATGVILIEGGDPDPCEHTWDDHFCDLDRDHEGPHVCGRLTDELTYCAARGDA